MLAEIKRKLFHLTSLIYVAGIIYLPRGTFLAAITLAFLIVAAIESLRLTRPGVNAWFQRWFGGLFRDEERDRLTGVFWMLLGVGLTALIVPPAPLAATAVLYLVLGDAAASLVGKAAGGPSWPGSPKRLAGSLACFAVCLAVGIALLGHDYGWIGIVAGAIAASLIEVGYSRLNDNLTIPVLSGLVLLLAYGIRPFIH